MNILKKIFALTIFSLSVISCSTSDNDKSFSNDNTDLNQKSSKSNYLKYDDLKYDLNADGSFSKYGGGSNLYYLFLEVEVGAIEEVNGDIVIKSKIGEQILLTNIDKKVPGLVRFDAIATDKDGTIINRLQGIEVDSDSFDTIQPQWIWPVVTIVVAIIDALTETDCTQSFPQLSSDCVKAGGKPQAKKTAGFFGDSCEFSCI